MLSCPNRRSRLEAVSLRRVPDGEVRGDRRSTPRSSCATELLTSRICGGTPRREHGGLQGPQSMSTWRARWAKINATGKVQRRHVRAPRHLRLGYLVLGVEGNATSLVPIRRGALMEILDVHRASREADRAILVPRDLFEDRGGGPRWSETFRHAYAATGWTGRGIHRAVISARLSHVPDAPDGVADTANGQRRRTATALPRQAPRGGSRRLLLL